MSTPSVGSPVSRHLRHQPWTDAYFNSCTQLGQEVRNILTDQMRDAVHLLAWTEIGYPIVYAIAGSMEDGE